MANLGTAYIRIAPDLSGIQGKVSRGMQGVGQQAGQQAGKQFGSGFQRLASDPLVGLGNKILKGTVVAGAVAAGAAIVSNIGNAIRRVDTLANSSRTFENMGIDADLADKAMERLVDSITGLPTPLDGAVRGMTALTATYGDVEMGQKVFSALNNAILGFGGSSEMVDNAIMQLSQLPMDGPLDAQTWNSLRNSGLTPVIKAMADDMGMGVAEMKEAFGSGELSVEDFTKKLTEMDKEGGGGLKSLEQIAKDSTAGIGTGFANMQTAISRGLANIIEEIGQANISNAIASIGDGFETVLTKFGEFVSFVIKHSDIFAPIAVAVGTFLGLIAGLAGVIKIVTIVQGIWNAVLLANPIVLIIVAVAALVAGLIYFFTQTELGQKIFETAMSAIKTAIGAVVNFFKAAWETIKAVWSVVAGWFGAIWGAVKAVFSGVIGFYRGIFQGAWNIIKGIWNAVSGWFQGRWDAIKNVFSNVGGWFRGVFQGAWDNITSIFGKMKTWANNRLDDIKSVFSATALLDAGKALINGFKDGISSAFEGAKKVVKDGMKAVRDFFPFSPAKEGPFSGMGYTTHSGKALMGDFAQGIASQANKARQTALQAMGGVQSAMTADYALNTGTGLTGALSGGISSNGSVRTTEIGVVNISSEVDGERWLRRLSGDQEITSAGLTPNQRYM